MSTPTPVPNAPSPAAKPRTQRPPDRHLPIFRIALLLLLAAVASVFEPHCFRWEVAQLLRFAAWRAEVHVQLGAVGGSLYGPVTIANSIWSYESENGPVTRVEIKKAQATLLWRELFRRGSGSWFRELSLEGLRGKIQLPIEAGAVMPKQREWLPRPSGGWFPAPERITASDVDFMFESDGDFVRLQDAKLTLSELEPGEIVVGQLGIKQPWLSRTFRNVKGATKLEGTRTELASVVLDPDVQIQTLSAELGDLARGRLNLEMQIAAFGGAIRNQMQTLPKNHQITFEAMGTFSQISIGRLASFLGLSDAAGGTIKEGKFTFRGAPENVAKATASLRLEATNFQWNSRQWDSLVLGVTLMDEHVQIPELTLLQGHNFLNLNGEMALPQPKLQWWENEFSFNIAAKIENLTELSALVLPEFQYAAGQATIDGSVRGKQTQFHGQLIVSGSNLTWHNAPIDELHATLKLNGNELQLANFSLFNDADFVRGRGVVNILGEKQYWGELHASVGDLSQYAAILQPPIVPEALAGGAVVNWSGEGSARGHTGEFLARLRKVRSLGASKALLHPLNADLEGTYQPGSMLFSRFSLSDDGASFIANVAVANQALSVTKIRFMSGQALQLEGDAVLPLDVGKAWPNTSLAKLLDPTTVSKVKLSAYNFDLHAASQLTGWNFPIAGKVLGDVVMEGPIGAIKSSGRFTIKDATLPVGWTGVLLRDVSAEASFDGQTLNIAKMSGLNPLGAFELTGQVNFADAREPVLQLAINTAKAAVPVFTDAQGDALVTVTTSSALSLEGPRTSAIIKGTVQLLSLLPHVPLDAAPLILKTSPKMLPPVFSLPDGPWSNWKWDAAIKAGPPAAIGNESHLDAELKLTGTVARPALVGVASTKLATAAAGEIPLLIRAASIEFHEDAPRNPEISFSASGNLYDEPLTITVDGPLSHTVRVITCAAPLTEELILTAVGRQLSPMEAKVSLEPAIVRANGNATFVWPPIATPAAPQAPVVPQPVVAPETPAISTAPDAPMGSGASKPEAP